MLLESNGALAGVTYLAGKALGSCSVQNFRHRLNDFFIGYILPIKKKKKSLYLGSCKQQKRKFILSTQNKPVLVALGYQLISWCSKKVFVTNSCSGTVCVKYLAFLKELLRQKTCDQALSHCCWISSMAKSYICKGYHGCFSNSYRKSLCLVWLDSFKLHL